MQCSTHNRREQASRCTAVVLAYSKADNTKYVAMIRGTAKAVSLGVGMRRVMVIQGFANPANEVSP